jgi:hypothetical protein
MAPSSSHLDEERQQQLPARRRLSRSFKERRNAPITGDVHFGWSVNGSRTTYDTSSAAHA